ncbi:hypothetical protein F4677DRAFT_303068 [Hypoxylon crocopeplum]|nr:hypothetical protein F4677DRAFT_303068 [Hypoxylon crocopeplum]
MIQLPTQVPTCCAWPISTLSKSNTEGPRYDLLGAGSSTYHMKASKMLSFPDPPRPPTPGPPPRPPPIPPRPPVPTPPPSPRSPAEAEWLQEAVATQLSIMAVRLVNVLFALGGPVSIPHPPRPPTPGPSRPGPIGPQPDVPTPPPSPRRSVRHLGYGMSASDESSKIGDLGAALLGRLFYGPLAFETYVSFMSSELTTCSSDSHDRADLDANRQLYDDKLTPGPEIPCETRLHTSIYSVAPKDVSDPHISHLGSSKASESSSSSWCPRAGAGTSRTNPDQA